MATYHATIRWTRGEDAFANQKYSRSHSWHFDEGLSVPASASPHVVRAPWSVAAAVDPEEALVAAVSSCHMLFLLSGASRAGFIVERYEDPAVGEMGKDADGRLAVTKVTLRPRVTVSGRAPTAAEFAALHHAAHEQCFIANSVRSEVVLEPELLQA
jgi:organic hydroperoxide reductase OsmC/OhrA